jgi:hypothetical protein
VAQCPANGEASAQGRKEAHVRLACHFLHLLMTLAHVRQHVSSATRHDVTENAAAKNAKRKAESGKPKGDRQAKSNTGNQQAKTTGLDRPSSRIKRNAMRATAASAA